MNARLQAVLEQMEQVALRLQESDATSELGDIIGRWSDVIETADAVDVADVIKNAVRAAAACPIPSKA